MFAFAWQKFHKSCVIIASVSITSEVTVFRTFTLFSLSPKRARSSPLKSAVVNILGIWKCSKPAPRAGFGAIRRSNFVIRDLFVVLVVTFSLPYDPSIHTSNEAESGEKSSQGPNRRRRA
jgi:hypothetical protein